MRDTTSDPNGTIRITVRDESKLSRYRFGLKTADFLVCADCGVYIGALMEEDGRQWMTVNANAFKPPPPSDFPATPVNFDAEDVPARLARRKAKWTPVSQFGLIRCRNSVNEENNQPGCTGMRTEAGPGRVQWRAMKRAPQNRARD